MFLRAYNAMKQAERIIKKTDWKRFLLPIGFILWLSIVFAPSLSSAQPENQEEKNSFPIPIEFLHDHDIRLVPRLKAVLNEIRNFIRKENTNGVHQEILKILDVKKEMDTKNLFPVSDYLILEAKRMVSLANFPMALALIDGAEKVSPSQGEVDFERACILFQQNPGNIPAAFSSLYSGFQKALKNRTEWSEIADDIMTQLLLATTLSFVLFIMLQFLFNLNPLFQDLRAFTPFTYEKVPTRIFAAALILLPFAVGGPMLFLLLVPVFLWGYLGYRSRFIIVLFFIYLSLIMPALMKELSREIVYDSSSVYRSLERISQGNWDHETLGHFKRELGKDNPSAHIYFGLGYIHKKRRDYEEAINHYQKYLEFYPNDAITLANIGTAYFEQGKLKEAVNYFNKAIAKNPNLFQAHLNLNLSYTELLDTNSAKKEYDKAVRLSPVLTKEFMDGYSKGDNRGNLDCLLPQSRVDEYLSTLNPKIDLCMKSIWRSTIGLPDYKSFITYVGGAVIFLVGLFYYKKSSGGFSHVCKSCGTVFIDPIQLTYHVREKCFQCSAVSSRRQIFDSRMKKEFQLKVYNYQGRIKNMGIGAALLFPGAGFLFKGRDFTGFIFCVVNSLILVVSAAILSKTATATEDMVGFIISNIHVMGFILAYYVLVTSVFLIKSRSD